ncbi:MAG: YqaA family protein [Hyphomicrobiaceae bacterium]
MMRALYNWMMRTAADRRAPHGLFWVAFAESSFFPIPPDVMLVPMVLANRAKAMLFAAIATAGSVIGGIAGYLIGYFFIDTIGMPIIEFYGKAASFESFRQLFNEWGVWILIIKGMTPIPYKILTITAGVTHMAIVPFIIASIIARSMRFFLVAALLYWFGPPIRDFIERRLGLVTTAFVVVLIGGFVAVRYLL